MATAEELNAKVDAVIAGNVRIKTGVAEVLAELKALRGTGSDPTALDPIMAKLDTLLGDEAATAADLEAAEQTAKPA